MQLQPLQSDPRGFVRYKCDPSEYSLNKSDGKLRGNLVFNGELVRGNIH